METVFKIVSQNCEKTPLDGDMLIEILSHVPLIDLVPASYVARAWKHSASLSLRHVNPLKPWLIVYTQNTRLNVVKARAYDSRSDLWMKKEKSQPLDAVLRSSHSNLLYALSPSRLSFSLDPLHLTWHHVDPPKVWRVDPIVAVVGHHVVVAGGSGYFEESPVTVEMYDLDSATWTSTCDPMPEVLKDSSSPLWLSAATDGHKLYLTEKQSGVTHTFDPSTQAWSGPFDLRPDQNIFYFVTTFINGGLILIGLIGDNEDVKGLKLWRVDNERFEEIGEMPKGLLEKLERENSPLNYSIGVCSAGNFLYIYSNSSTAEEVYVCELGDGGCKWWSIQKAAAAGGMAVMERTVFTCSEVGFDDVYNASRAENGRFIPLLL